MRVVPSLLALLFLLLSPTLSAGVNSSDTFSDCVRELNRTSPVRTGARAAEYSLAVDRSANMVCPRNDGERRVLLKRYLEALFPRGASVSVRWGSQTFSFPQQ